VWRIATCCQTQQFRPQRQEAPKSICGTESGRIKWGAVKSPRSAELGPRASRARAHPRNSNFLVTGNKFSNKFASLCARIRGQRSVILEPAAVAPLDVATFNFKDKQPSIGIRDNEITFTEDPVAFHQSKRVPGVPALRQARLQGFVQADFRPHGTR